jgi:hypothetical protein
MFAALDPTFQRPLIDKAASAMRQLCDITAPSSFTPDNTDFILRQGIPYEAEDRLESAERIVQHMVERQRVRLQDPEAAMDKTINPLIVVVNGPGVGKSTFLVHLIEYPAYQQYCKGVPPIFAPLTFNSGMSSGPVALGMRMLFGAATAMGHFKDVDISWDCFADTMLGREEDLVYLTASSAVETLHQLYGPERRVLLLVDELAAAADLEKRGDERVVQQLLGVVGEHGSTDVIISALSAPYIRDLVWKFSTRSTTYEPLQPLYRLESGRKACTEWAGKVLGAHNVTDHSVKALLERAVRLVSGHGRSLERLLEAFVAREGSLVPSEVPDHKLTSFPVALSWLVTEIAQVCMLNQPSARCMEEYVLQTCSLSVDDQRQVRRQLQEGTLVMRRHRPGLKTGKGFLGVALATLFRPLGGGGEEHSAKDLRRCPRLRMFIELVSSVRKLSHLWERCLDLTILVRSASAGEGKLIFLNELFGAPGLAGFVTTMATRLQGCVQPQRACEPDSAPTEPSELRFPI